MILTCGFIGLGQMGGPMARNLAQVARVLVWARDARQAEPAMAAGAQLTTDAKAFAEASVVFLCLPNGDVVEDVLFGAFGLASALPKGAVIVDTSTIEYAQALAIHRRLAALGVGFFDAPVSGMQARAEAGTLTMMCGASEAEIAPLRPLLATMASNILPMGQPGSGQLAKLINQLLFDIAAAALAEVLPLAVKLGLDPDQIGAIVNSGTGRSYASEFFIPNILRGDFSKGYPMAAAYKDLVSGAEISARHGIPMPVLAAATVVYQSALRAGHGDKDKGGMIRLAEEALGVAFRSKNGGNTMSDETGIRRGLTNYGDKDFAQYLRNSFARSMGLSREMLAKPIVGIAMTPSSFNNCHRAMPELVDAVSRGVLAAGALPMPFPTTSLGEVFLNPTSMVYRNLMAMDTEEMVRAQPMDAVVLIGGCDKTVPAQIMGAISAGLPAVQLVTGPMSTGRHRGERLGACTDCRRFWAKYRAGEVDQAEIAAVEGRLATTAGTCAVMGTASTMACIAETLGLSLPGTAAIPAVHADRLVAAEQSGAVAVELIKRPIVPQAIVTQKSIENALRVLMAVSGSTNAVVHLAAIAGRLGIRITRELFNRISDETPVLVDLKPVGDGYMEDFHAAGGVGAVLREIRHLLHLDTINVLGQTLGERLSEPLEWVDRKVIRPFAEPVSPVGGLIALEGNLAPEGAILKRAAATPALFEIEGCAVVFEDLPDLAKRIDDPALDVEANDILVLKNAGPVAAGMPEAGYLPIPKKLAQKGVKDMVRISDARMSGTAFGTIVLHVAPESAVGGPLAAVRNGDRIRLSVSEKSIRLLVDEAEIARRLASLPKRPMPARGYQALYARSVQQAPAGCDFDFLAAEPAETQP